MPTTLLQTNLRVRVARDDGRAPRWKTAKDLVDPLVENAERLHVDLARAHLRAHCGHVGIDDANLQVSGLHPRCASTSLRAPWRFKCFQNTLGPAALWKDNCAPRALVGEWARKPTKLDRQPLLVPNSEYAS